MIRLRGAGCLIAAALCAGAVGAQSTTPAPKPAEPVRQVAIRATGSEEKLARLATPGESTKGAPPLAAALTVVVTGDGRADSAALSAGDYEAMLVAESGNGATRRRIYQLFARDTSRLTRDEREAMAQAMKGLLAARRLRGASPGSAAEVAAFLHENRREADEGVFGFEVEKDGATIEGRVMDAKGRPIPGRLAYVFHYDPESREVRVAGSDRSEADGTVSFPRLPPGGLYRVEVAPGTDGLAWSGVARLDAGEFEGLPPLVVTPASRRSSGLVLWQGEPAAGVRVRSMGPAQPTLSTTTDENGVFSLAPLREGEVMLSFSRADIDRDSVRIWRTHTGGEEAVIPLDLVPSSLKSPEPRGGNFRPRTGK